MMRALLQVALALCLLLFVQASSSTSVEARLIKPTIEGAAPQHNVDPHLSIGPLGADSKLKAVVIEEPTHEAAAPAPATPQQQPLQPSLLEVEAAPATARPRRFSSGTQSRRYGTRGHGWGVSPIPPRRVQQRLPEPRLTGAASALTRANVKCVMCQFVVQKLQSQLINGDNKEGEGGEKQAAASASLIEAFSFASAEAKAHAEQMVAADAAADAKAAAIPALFDHGKEPQRRFRHTDILAHRASRHRFSEVRHASSSDHKAQHEAHLKLYSTVYASFEQLCTKNMPLAYLPYCNDMLKSYRFIAQGINYGDRADQVCMNGNFCDHRSYVRMVTHATYQREPGDA